MKKYIQSSRSSGKTISAIDLKDKYYDNRDGLVAYLDSLPVNTEIVDIVNAHGSHFDGQQAICKKCEGYETVYYNPYGVPPSDSKYKTTWWSLSGSKTHAFDIAKIILKGTRYYCTREVFEGDEF